MAWSRTLERSLCYSYGCWEVLESRRPRPIDLIVGRSAGLGSTLFAPVYAPAPPRVNLFDYYFHPRQNDLADEIGADAPAAYVHWRRSANAVELLDLEQCDLAWTPTHWQRHLFPAEYRDDLWVQHDGVATAGSDDVAPRDRRMARDDGRSPAGSSRGDARRQLRGPIARPPPRLRPVLARGQRLAPRPRRRDLRGRGRPGRPARAGHPFPQPRLSRPPARHLSRRSIPSGSGSWGGVTPGVVREVLAASDLHLAPGRPYPVARSLLEAMAAGCVVLASDTAPHREVLSHGQTGLLADPADPERSDPPGAGGPGRPGRASAPGRRRGRAGPVAIRPGRLPSPACRAVLDAGRHAAKGMTAMHVLFIHDAFPAQFGRLGLELKKRYGWRCSFLVQSLSSCPTPSTEMLQELELHQLPLAAEHRSSDGIPWPQIFGMYLEQCQAVFEALRARPELRPDLVVAHGGRGAPDALSARPARLPDHQLLRVLLRHQPSRHLVPDRPAPRRAGPFLPPLHQRPHAGEPGRLRRRLLGHAVAEAVVPRAVPFPRSRCYFDGIDTELYRPGPAPRRIGEADHSRGHEGRHVRRPGGWSRSAASTCS